MSDELPGPVPPPERPFAADRPKNNRAKCKRCKLATEADKLRLGRYVVNGFSAAGGWTKSWFHPACMWEAFAKQRASTKKIEDPAKDIDGWEELVQEDMDEIVAYLRSTGATVASPKATRKAGDPATPKPRAKKKGKQQQGEAGTPSTPKTPAKPSTPKTPAKPATPPPPPPQPSKDDYFRAFRKLCVQLSDEPGYLNKTALVTKLFKEGTDGGGFKGNLETWVRLLLPMVQKRVYNLQSKQLVKLFSRILQASEEAMLEDLNQGDVAATISYYFEESKAVQAAAKSTILVAEVDDFLEKLAGMTREEEQGYHFKQLTHKCTVNDLKMVIRLIKHDLRINAGPKHILAAVHPDAYEAYQTCRDLRAVVQKAASVGARGTFTGDGLDAAGPAAKDAGGSGGASSSNLSIGINIMTPVLPMLAEACKSVEQAMKKCPNGMYSEIKYDGERVQLHKKGDEFKFFSRALKPVMAHKVNHFKEFIPDAFPSGEDLILDSEILLVDNKTGKPLPFGSLGVHKKTAFQDANVCLFVFDCMYYNGESLMQKSMKRRRKILERVMVEIPNRVVLSEQEEIHCPADLTTMMEKVFRLGLEGLVLKDLEGPYEPGKRHWLKVKKDYLFGGAMADTADLVVLGAFYGTGQKGGMKSIFLMGCYDPGHRRWVTVTKVHGGHDDATLARLQTELKMVEINKDPGKIPSWLKANKPMYPDFVTVDPKESQVWEITGAEFTQTEVHTADGISVRFPRVTRIRDDKEWQQATSLPELRELYKKSKETSTFSLSAAASSAAGSPAKTASPTRAGGRTAAGSSRGSPTKRPLADDSPQKAKTGPAKPLPDVFQGVALRMPRGLGDDEQYKLRRYFVGYGGRLLDRRAKDPATHVLRCPNATEAGSRDGDAVVVDVKWLWDSVKRQRLMDTKGYSL